MTAAIWRNRWRAHRGFFAALAALLLASAVAGAMAWRELGRWREAEVDGAHLRVERSLPQTRPEMVASTRAALASAQTQLSSGLARWPGPCAAATVDPIEVFSGIAEFVERHRAAAAQTGVSLAKDECFGFGQYRNEAPPPAAVAAVLAQQETLDRILPALFRASPTAVLKVERDNANPDQGTSGGWSLPWASSVRVPGVVEARALRIKFTGTADCLRRFLNRVAGEPGLVVREVAVGNPVSPRSGDSGREAAAGGGGGGRTFDVAIETVTIMGGRLDRSAVPEARVALWPETAFKNGARWYDLFGALIPEPAQEPDRVAAAGAGSAASVDATGGRLAPRREPARWRLVGCVAERLAVIEVLASRRILRLAIGESDAQSGVTLRELLAERADDGTRAVRAMLEEPASGALVPVFAGESAVD